MNGYGDRDPEDAYDATDPATVRLDVLERIIFDLETDREDARWDRRRLDALRLVANLDAEFGVDRIRLAYIRDALEAL